MITAVIFPKSELSRPIIQEFSQKDSNFAGIVSREADELVKPHDRSLTIFNEWLAAHSVDPTSVSRTAAADWATLSVPVSVAETMLGCEFHVYEHTESGMQAVRTLEYSLPRPLVGHIDTIQPTTYFGFGYVTRDLISYSPFIELIYIELIYLSLQTDPQAFDTTFYI